jgi:hypothetical protein
MRWRTAATLGLALALALAGCGDDDTGDAAGADGTAAATGGTDDEAVDGGACELVTDDDVADALPDVGDLVRESTSPLACSFATEDRSTVVTVTIQPGALDERSFADATDELRRVERTELEAVEGIGDEAVAVSQPFPVLLVGVGDDLVTVSVVTDDDVDAHAAQRELAGMVLSRM